LSFFITLEGPDGSGKTRQAMLLSQRLGSLDYDVLLTREPGGTEIGEQIRKVLTSLDNTRMDPRAEFLLFSASRAQHVQERIRPHLEGGGVVICDRFFDASMAYQGYGHQLDLETLRTITSFATQGLEPDLTILLDIPVEQGLHRREQGGNWNRLDGYDLEFHRRVQKGYLALAKSQPERWVTVDGLLSIEQVHADILHTVEKRLGISPSA
jgi:dTMP kinase